MEIPPHCRIPLSSSSVEVPKRFPESRPREQNGVCLSVLGKEGGGGSQKRKTVPLGLQIGRIPVTEEGRKAGSDLSASISQSKLRNKESEELFPK